MLENPAGFTYGNVNAIVENLRSLDKTIFLMVILNHAVVLIESMDKPPTINQRKYTRHGLV